MLDSHECRYSRRRVWFKSKRLGCCKGWSNPKRRQSFGIYRHFGQKCEVHDSMIFQKLIEYNVNCLTGFCPIGTKQGPTIQVYIQPKKEWFQLRKFDPNQNWNWHISDIQKPTWHEIHIVATTRFSKKRNGRQLERSMVSNIFRFNNFANFQPALILFWGKNGK